MSATFRVLLEMDVTQAHAAEFEATWSEIADSVAANPANQGQALMRSCEHPCRYHVLSDWTDETAFRSFERSAEHVRNRARLAPYRGRVAMTTVRIVAQPGRATTRPSTMDGAFRVMLRMQIHPGMEDEFEGVWLASDADLATEPASVRRWLLRSSMEESVYLIVSDWVDEDGFRAFERSAIHLAHRAKLHPYRSSGSFTAMHVVRSLAGAASGDGPR